MFIFQLDFSKFQKQNRSTSMHIILLLFFCIISPQSVKHMENTFTHMCAATIIKRFPWAYIRFNLFLTPKRVCDAYVPFADCPFAVYPI